MENEIDIEESAFAHAFAEAQARQKGETQAPAKKEQVFQSANPQGISRQDLAEFRRITRETELLASAAGETGKKWAEYIDSPIVNPKKRRIAVRAWRPVWERLRSGPFTNDQRARVIYELESGMGIKDSGISDTQMHYMQGVAQKGWFDQIKRIPELATPGIVYFIAAFGDLSEFSTKERTDLHGYLRDSAGSAPSREDLRLDKVVARWIGSSGRENKRIYK